MCQVLGSRNLKSWTRRTGSPFQLESKTTLMNYLTNFWVFRKEEYKAGGPAHLEEALWTLSWDWRMRNSEMTGVKVVCSRQRDQRSICSRGVTCSDLHFQKISMAIMLNQVVQLPLPVIIHCSLTPPLSVFHILTLQERCLLGQLITIQHRALRGTHKPGESWASLWWSLCPKDHLFLGHWLQLSGHKTWPLDSDWLGLRVSGVSRTAVRTKQRCQGWRTIAFEDSLKSVTRQRTRTRTLHMHSSFIFWWEGRKGFQKNKVRGLTPSDFKTHHKAIITRSVWYSMENP